MNLTRLPLDSPRWLEIRAGASVPGLLKEIQETGKFGTAWDRLRDIIIQQGSVYEATYAALPHVVGMAAQQDPRNLGRFWIDIGFIAAAIDRPRPYRKPIPDDLKRGLRAALLAAETLAIRCFQSREWGRQGKDTGPETASYLALACLALNRHPVGGLIEASPGAPRPGKSFASQLFVTVMCRACEAELEFMHAGAGIAEYRQKTSLRGKPDPEQPEPEPPPVPSLSSSRRKVHPWVPIATALTRRTAFPKTFLARHGGHVPVAAAIAAAGVPRRAPPRAVLSLLGVLVALGGALDWAGRLLRLAGDMRCPDCGAVQSFAKGLPIGAPGSS